MKKLLGSDSSFEAMAPKEEFCVRETKPNILGLKNSTRDKPSLVQVQQFLYVRVVRAKNLPLNPTTWSCDPYVELRIGNYRGTTESRPNNSSPRWGQVFCFRKEILHSRTLEVSVKDRKVGSEIGTLSIPIADAPTRLPGDGSLAPQKYSLQKNGNYGYGDLMMALWIGGQTDDEYGNASLAHASGAGGGDRIDYVRDKTYQQPRLWYLTVKLIDAVDLVPLDPNGKLQVRVRARLGKKVLKTKASSNKSFYRPSWNEEFMFVAAEPFDETLVLILEDENTKHVYGFYDIPLHRIHKRLVDRAPSDIWIDLKQPHSLSGEVRRFAGKLHLNLYLDGVYHVFDEPVQFSSDLTATSPKMKPGSIGKLHLGIVKAPGLAHMHTENGIQTNNAYCVARYGCKWIRTSTIVDSLEPKWNEQYQWDVYDPCTVITIGVFDNCNLQAGRGSTDSIIGMVRIRLSELESGKIYTLAFPLVRFNRDGMKKVGELHLNFMFYCPNMWNLLSTYALPLLPKAHHTHPLSAHQLDTLRSDAVALICSKFRHSKPRLRREVVECMLSAHPRVWSLRRARANYQRVMHFGSYFSTAWKWYGDIREWKDPVQTVTVWLYFVLLLSIPWLIQPTFFFAYLLWTIIRNYRKRPKHPLFLDTKLSRAESATLGDWQEEFDTFESSAQGEFLRERYDRLRRIGEWLVMSLGGLANQLERVECVTSWRDPRATFLFGLFCAFAALVTYCVPLKLLIFFLGTYMLRFPKLRVAVPSIPQNFLRRLPSKEDCML